MKVCVYAIYNGEPLANWIKSVQGADYISIINKTKSPLPEDFSNFKNNLFTIMESEENNLAVLKNKVISLAPNDTDIFISLDINETFTNDDSIDIIKNSFIESGANILSYNCQIFSEYKLQDQKIIAVAKAHTRDFKWENPIAEKLYAIDDNVKEEMIYLPDEIFLERYLYSVEQLDLKNYLELLIQENPNNFEVKNYCAKYHYLKGDLTTALGIYIDLLKCPELDLEHNRHILYESLEQCALIYKELKNYDLSIWYAQELIKEDPTYREPYFLLAQLYYDMHMYTLAEAMLKVGFEYGIRKYVWMEDIDNYKFKGEYLLSKTLSKLGKIAEITQYIDIALEYLPDDIDLLKIKIATMQK